MTPGRSQLDAQLQALRSHGLLQPLILAAQAASIPSALFAAIASRETNCRNILGDLVRESGYHGVGLVQIDVQHDIARKARDDGSWQSPHGTAALLEFGAQLLASNLREVRRVFPTLDELHVTMIAAAGYNCGIARAIESWRGHLDPDVRTTGHDYGHDVVARASVFAELLDPAELSCRANVA